MMMPHSVKLLHIYYVRHNLYYLNVSQKYYSRILFHKRLATASCKNINWTSTTYRRYSNNELQAVPSKSSVEKTNDSKVTKKNVSEKAEVVTTVKMKVLDHTPTGATLKVLKTSDVQSIKKGPIANITSIEDSKMNDAVLQSKGVINQLPKIPLKSAAETKIVKPANSEASVKIVTEKVQNDLVTSPVIADKQRVLNEKLTSTLLESKSSSADTLLNAVQVPLPKLVGDKVVQTQKVDIPTSKGLLSVTTTIEDSKINSIVFEKGKILPEAALPAEPIPKLIEQILDEKIIKTPNSKGKVDTKTELNIATGDASAAATAAVAASVVIAEKAKETDAPKPKRAKVDFNRSSLERNFITPARAMADFLLKASDLENLTKIKRRSPYEQEPPITVYWRKDVEAKAIEIWGSRESLLKESLRRQIEQKKYQQNLFTVKRRLRDYRREIGSRTVVYDSEPGLKGKSGRVVLIAVGINGINFLFKVCGWFYTGSHSMFAEAIHSLADTINQLILAYGIHKSTQVANPDHPYGYSNMKYVSSLISGVGIFCVGAGLSFYHGIIGLTETIAEPDFYWAFYILGGSLVSEGATLLVAVNEIRRAAKEKGISFKDYVISGKDPCVNVVLTEDAAAVTSVALAAGCMGLTSLTGSGLFDAVGSLLVGSILGCVASFIIYTNVQALVGKSIPAELLEKINAELESDIMIRAIHDVKGIDMGNSLVRYKAEMDFDGRELTRFYVDKQDLSELLKLVKSFQTPEELEQFLLMHGENIVDLMGGEIDRIEMKLRKKFPEIRHCDLEIL